MIESTSSCTKASGVKSNCRTAKGTMARRNSAPGSSSCFAIQASKRPAMPAACGMPPMPAGCSITRRLSVIANWPSRKKPSRGVVAIQFGLPRPAFRNAWAERFDVAFARVISSSLISNGLRDSRFRSFTRSMTVSYVPWISSRQQHDEDHAPDREQRVPDGVGHRVTERGHLALPDVADQAERRRRRARSGEDAEQERVVEAEDILSDVHAEDQGHGSRHGAPQEEADALRLQALDETRSGRDADHGDEHVEADRVHEPHGGRRDAPEGRTHRAQPAEHQARD